MRRAAAPADPGLAVHWRTLTREWLPVGGILVVAIDIWRRWADDW
jgi:hypothetical protein